MLVNLSSGNDDCSEHKSFNLIIPAISFSQALNNTQLSFDFNAADASETFITGTTYKWYVQALKGAQTINSSSTFKYCKPDPLLIDTLYEGFLVHRFSE